MTTSTIATCAPVLSTSKPKIVFPTFEAALSEILTYAPNVSQNQIEDAIETYNTYISDCLDSDYSPTPDSYFERIGSGAFKAVYSFLPGWVIKFVSEENNTKREIRLLNKAYAAGVSDHFAKTFFLPLENPAFVRLEDDFWDGSDSSSDDYDGDEEDLPSRLGTSFCNWVIFQEEVNVAIDYTPIPAFEGEPIYYDTGEEVSKSIKSLFYYNPSWLTVLAQQGKEATESLAAFLDHNCVHDLHSGNLGYSKDYLKTLILDWLS